MGEDNRFFHEHQGSTVAHVEPQAYGRAGGYVGADRVAVLESATPNQANGTPNEVRTGEAAMGNGADTRVRPDVTAGSSESNNSSSTSQDSSSTYQGQMRPANPDSSAPAASDSSGRTSGDRFDNADRAHGQSETGTQTR